MAYWLLKTEPSAYSWDDLARDARTAWTGVRNFQAAKNLRSMKAGDFALVYHSGGEKAAVGIARVARAAYQDPTTKEDWPAVDVKAVRPLPRTVSLAAMKADKALAGMAVVRQGRLSVSPVAPAEWKRLLALAGAK